MEVRHILERIKDGRLSVEEGIDYFKGPHYLDVGCAKIDTHREERVGYPEGNLLSGKND